jgi:phage shock protein PspC (stress-responsive transcriptional regulator)
MNKTIIININGIVFHIEEDAYEILKNYMTDVKRHFMNSADSLEITTDIENRIAEMFGELLLKDNKQVITDQDVLAVIEQMGSVADFEHADDDGKTGPHTYAYNNRVGRRLFRDPDDHLVAGVCAGIANYFDIDVVWIRLLFALSFAAAGSGFILYMILWIVVPRAITRADRMAMKGEKQNLQGFKKNFEEELNTVRQNISNFGEEAKPFVYKVRDFIGDFLHHFIVFLNGAGRLLVKLLGVIILLTCFGFMVTIVVMFVTVIGFGNIHILPGTPFALLHNRYLVPVGISAFLVAFIPLLAIMLFTLRGIFNTASVNSITGTSALVVWLCAIGTLTFYAVKLTANFRQSAGFTETITIKPTPNNTYYLKLNNLKYFTASDSARLNIKNLFRNGNIRLTDDDADPDIRNVHISVEKSDINKPVLVESYSARGRSYDDALFNVRNTKYIFGQKDSVLTFDAKLLNVYDDEWHSAEIYLTLKLPMNAKVVIDNDLTRVLNADVWACNINNKKNNDKVKYATFIMTDNGLQCKVDTLVTTKKDSAGTVPADSLQAGQ